MHESPLCRFAASPEGDDCLCCGAALAGSLIDGYVPVLSDTNE